MKPTYFVFLVGQFMLKSDLFYSGAIHSMTYSYILLLSLDHYKIPPLKQQQNILKNVNFCISFDKAK